MSRLPLYVVFRLFCHFQSRSGPNNSHEPCFLSHTSVTVTAETSVIGFIGSHPIKSHLEGGNYYAGKLLFSNSLRNAVILTEYFYAYGQRGGEQLDRK